MTGNIHPDTIPIGGQALYRHRLRYFGWIDIVVILFIVTGTIITIPILGNHTPSTVTIHHNNRILATYPLGSDRTFPVNGSRGQMTITIKNGGVTVSQADCPLGICEKTGEIRHPHSQIVCAPNQVIITINSSSPDTLDAIAK